jgi:serine/threonine protein kinase
MSSFFRRIGSRVAGLVGAASGEAAPARFVIDAAGNRHELVEELGRGGQGAVFRTANREIAVKLLLDGKGDPLRSTGSVPELELRGAIERVLTLALPARGVAAPIALLREEVGYTMRMLAGMQPLASMMALTRSRADYGATGGLRRRLGILATLADRVASLHSAGLVFTDLSPNNVFISSSVDASEVWLIDPDNIHYLEQGGRRLYTPRYGAPEVVSGRGYANTLTDCWSFAVIAHEVLRVVHPFEGDGLEESGWDGTASGVQKPGEAPLVWIDDPDDGSNRTGHGRQLAEVATGRMTELFGRAFCAGRTDPTARPSMSEWADALWEAYDHVVLCSSCGGSSFVSKGAAMSCCDAARPAVLRIESRLWVPGLDKDLNDLAQSMLELERLDATLDAVDPDRAPAADGKGPRPQRPPLASMRVASGITSSVPMSFVTGAGAERKREPAIELRYVGGRLMVEVLGECGGWSWIDGRSARPRSLARKFDVEIGTTHGYVCHVHCGNEGEPHRLLTFTHFPGAANAG